MMAELLYQYHLGVVVKGWTSAALAQAINTLSAEQIMNFKSNSDQAARELNAEHEGKRFLEMISATSHERQWE